MSSAADRLALRRDLFLCMSRLDNLNVLKDALLIDNWKSSIYLDIERINKLAATWNQQIIFRIVETDKTIQELWIDHPTIDRPVLIAAKAIHSDAPFGLSEYARLEAVANLSAWIELAAGQTEKPPPKPIERDKKTEARDKWIYGLSCAKIPYLTIVNRLKKKPKWEQIDTEQGIIDAARRYANRHGIDQPPRRRNN